MREIPKHVLLIWFLDIGAGIVSQLSLMPTQLKSAYCFFKHLVFFS